MRPRARSRQSLDRLSWRSNSAALGLFGAAAIVTATGCGNGVNANDGGSEPLQVLGGQFYEGSLPVGDKGPAIIAPLAQNNTLFAGQSNKVFTGNAEQGATALAVRVEGHGTGYWTFPVGLADPQTKGELTWSANCDFSSSLSAGTYDLAFSATNAKGEYGPEATLPLTVVSVVPLGQVVFSLTWDSSADLDLHVISPDGSELNPKHPITVAALDGGADSILPEVGVLNRDSNASCAQDGFREEDLVFAGTPAPGDYVFNVDMFASCGAPAADFVLTVRVDGIVQKTFKGRLLDIDADGGGPGSGLHITRFTF